MEAIQVNALADRVLAVVRDTFAAQLSRLTAAQERVAAAAEESNKLHREQLDRDTQWRMDDRAYDKARDAERNDQLRETMTVIQSQVIEAMDAQNEAARAWQEEQQVAINAHLAARDREFYKRAGMEPPIDLGVLEDIDDGGSDDTH